MAITRLDREGSVKLVPAVVRAVAILDAIAQTGDGLRLSELVRKTGFPKSSVHGLCQTLVQTGLLKLNIEGSFTIGPKVMRWADAFLASTDILNAFHNALSRVTEFDTYTLTLSQLDGAEVVYLDCRNSSAPLGISFRRGMRVPAIFTATGKAMLAGISVEMRTSHLPSDWPVPLTSTSVTSLAALEQELKQARLNGYSIDNEQLREGMFCIGAAIYDSQSRPVAGIGLSMLAVEAKPEVISRVGARLRTLADAVAEEMGWQPAVPFLKNSESA